MQTNPNQFSYFLFTAPPAFTPLFQTNVFHPSNYAQFQRIYPPPFIKGGFSRDNNGHPTTIFYFLLLFVETQYILPHESKKANQNSCGASLSHLFFYQPFVFSFLFRRISWIQQFLIQGNVSRDFFSSHCHYCMRNFNSSPSRSF